MVGFFSQGVRSRGFRTAAATARCRAGVTLVEVIVCISIVAILIGLTLPSLGRARESARSTHSLSNLRQIASIHSLYAGQADDSYPVGELGRIYPVSIDGESVAKSIGNQFEFDRGWIVMVRDIVPWHDTFPALVSPPDRPPSPAADALPSLSYVLSRSVMAKPNLWRLGALPEESLLRGMRHSDVAYPSAKAISWDSHLSYALDRTPSPIYPKFLARPIPILGADGHALERLIADAATPVANVMSQPLGDDRPLHNTPLGVKGRDF